MTNNNYNSLILIAPIKKFYPETFFSNKLNKSWDIFLSAKKQFEQCCNYMPQNSIKERIEVLEKSPLDFMTEQDYFNMIILKLQTLNSRNLYNKETYHEWEMLCKRLNHYNNAKENKTIILTQSYCHFMMALGRNYDLQNDIQLKLLDQAILKLQIINNGPLSHPYLDLYEALLLIAHNEWQKATYALHHSCISNPSPDLFKILGKLYKKINQPRVANYFDRKGEIEVPPSNFLAPKFA